MFNSLNPITSMKKEIEKAMENIANVLQKMQELLSKNKEHSFDMFCLTSDIEIINEELRKNI